LISTTGVRSGRVMIKQSLRAQVSESEAATHIMTRKKHEGKIAASPSNPEQTTKTERETDEKGISDVQFAVRVYTPISDHIYPRGT
jgi:hypothetical protein